MEKNKENIIQEANIQLTSRKSTRKKSINKVIDYGDHNIESSNLIQTSKSPMRTMQIEAKKSPMPTNTDKLLQSKTKKDFSVHHSQNNSNNFTQMTNMIEKKFDTGSKSMRTTKENETKSMSYLLQTPSNSGKRYQTGNQAPRCKYIILLILNKLIR